MTITREWIEEYRDRFDGAYDDIIELCDLALIGLAVRDKESGLVEAMAKAEHEALRTRDQDYSRPWDKLLPTVREMLMDEQIPALSAITAYRSE